MLFSSSTKLPYAMKFPFVFWNSCNIPFLAGRHSLFLALLSYHLPIANSSTIVSWVMKEQACGEKIFCAKQITFHLIQGYCSSSIILKESTFTLSGHYNWTEILVTHNDEGDIATYAYAHPTQMLFYQGWWASESDTLSLNDAFCLGREPILKGHQHHHSQFFFCSTNIWIPKRPIIVKPYNIMHPLSRFEKRKR